MNRITTRKSYSGASQTNFLRGKGAGRNPSDCCIMFLNSSITMKTDFTGLVACATVFEPSKKIFLYIYLVNLPSFKFSHFYVDARKIRKFFNLYSPSLATAISAGLSSCASPLPLACSPVFK